jgi:hypothetical protein
MDEKITTLNNNCKDLAAELKRTRIDKENAEKCAKVEKNQLIEKHSLRENENKQALQHLKNKVNQVMEMFGALESVSNNSEIEWSMWKERWNNEKLAYINRVN